MVFNKILFRDLAFPNWCYVTVLYISSLALTGYQLYAGNHAFELPLVHRLTDSSLYPDDPLVSSVLYHPSLLWRILALGNRLGSLEPLLLSLFLFERLLVLYAAGRLAASFSPGSRLATTGAMAMFALAPTPILGAGTLVEGYVEQTGLSIPFLLLAIASFYKACPISWAIWLAIGFNLTSLYGMYAMTYFMAIFLFDSRYRSDWKKWILSVSLFALLASPAIFLTASAIYFAKPYDGSLWLAAILIRCASHLDPLTWGKGAYIKFFTLVLLSVLLLYQSRLEKEFTKLFRHGLVWLGVSISWLVCAFLAAYIVKSPSLLAVMPARGTDLWYCFAGISLISICAHQIERNAGNRKLLTVAYVASVFFFWHPISFSLLIFCFLAVLLWKPIWNLAFGKELTARLAFVLTLSVVALGLYSLQARWALHGAIFIVLQPTRAFKEVADWAQATTSVGAIFLVNPNWQQFRALSRRPVFVTWKDGAALVLDRSFVEEWVRRLGALGFDITRDQERGERIPAKLTSLYRALDDNDVARLRVSFPIQYWIAPVEHVSTFPSVFKNKSYQVLDVRNNVVGTNQKPLPALN